MSGVEEPLGFIDAGDVHNGPTTNAELAGGRLATIGGLVAAVTVAVGAGLLLSSGRQPAEPVQLSPTTSSALPTPPTTVAPSPVEAAPGGPGALDGPILVPEEPSSIASSPLSALDAKVIVRLVVSSHLSGHISVLDVDEVRVIELSASSLEDRVFPSFDPTLRFDISGRWLAGLGASSAPAHSPVLWLGPAQGPLRPVAVAVDGYTWDLARPGRLVWANRDGAAFDVDATTGAVGDVQQSGGRIIQVQGDETLSVDAEGITLRSGVAVASDGVSGLGFAPGGVLLVDADGQLAYIADDTGSADSDATPADAALEWGDDFQVRFRQAAVEADPTGRLLALSAQDARSRSWMAVTDINGRVLLSFDASEGLGPVGWDASGRFLGFTIQTDEFVNHVYVFDTSDGAIYSTAVAGVVEGVQRVADVAVIVES